MLVNNEPAGPRLAGPRGSEHRDEGGKIWSAGPTALGPINTSVPRRYCSRIVASGGTRELESDQLHVTVVIGATS